MPIPAPRANEKRSKFIARCMGNAQMIKDYPTQSQRSAVCHSAWRKKHNALAAYLSAQGWSPCQIKAELARIDRENG